MDITSAYTISRRSRDKVVENDAEITDYPINSYVLYNTPPTGRGNKLLSKHRGPYQVRGWKQSIYFI